MLKCKDIAAHASEYTDKDLSLWMKLQFKVHLAICKACQRYVAQMQQTVKLVKKSKSDDVSEETMKALKAQFEKAKSKNEIS